ncbi:MAG: bZIP transcription factor, partial [Deltaproteobacteria bacterium]|nr:bZIP transcription factor [Deltaproteobacteria bacterium]
ADVSKEVSQAASQTVTSLSPSDTAKPDPVVKESPTDTFVDSTAATAAAPKQMGQEPTPEKADSVGPITATSLEVGPATTSFAPENQDSTAILILPPEEDTEAIKTNFEARIKELTEENAALKSRVKVLEAQNELLFDRLKFSDKVLINITEPK